MNNCKKMNISELKPRQPDPIDWLVLDEFFNKDAPTLLAQPLILSNIIRDNNILEIPEINSNTITGYLNGIVRDTQTLSANFTKMKQEYDNGRRIYFNNYDENAHMFSLSVTHDMVSWLEQYDDTVGLNFNEVIDYINSFMPNESKVTINK